MNSLITLLIGVAVGFVVAYAGTVIRQKALQKLLDAINNTAATTIGQTAELVASFGKSLAGLRREVRRTRKAVARVVERQFQARTFKPETAEGRIEQAAKVVQQSWNKDTLDKGVEQLKRFYEEEGAAIPPDAKLREEAEELLNASIQGETVLE